MTMPRQVLLGVFYLITRRCTQRQFLLRPDEETNNAFTYLLGVAAELFGIEIILPSAMSNHHHTVVFDRHGRISEFVQHFHKLLAKCQNAYLGRTENFWSSTQVSLVRLGGPEDVLDEVVYAAANPVLSDLVEHVADWPGVNGLSALVNDVPMVAQRPRHFFRANGVMPAKVEFRLLVPPELGDRSEFVARVRARVAEVEREQSAARLRSGRSVLGRARILRQSWRDAPSTYEPPRALSPRIAAKHTPLRRALLDAYHQFVQAYRVARAALLAGREAIFPRGTYWLRRHAGVTVAA